MSSIIEVVALALQRKHDDRFLIARRGPDQSGAGFWEFPGGKVEPFETHTEALVREINEEFSIKLNPAHLQFVDTAEHQYEIKKIKLFLWRSLIDTVPELILTDHDQIQWCHPHEMRQLKLSPGDIYFIDKLL